MKAQPWPEFDQNEHERKHEIDFRLWLHFINEFVCYYDKWFDGGFILVDELQFVQVNG